MRTENLNTFISPYALPGIRPTERPSIRYLHFAHLEKVVCDAYGIDDTEKLKQKTRKKHIVEARHVCMFIIREHKKETVERIGKYFLRDHSSVLHGVGKIKDLMSFDQPLRHKMSIIYKTLGI